MVWGFRSSSAFSELSVSFVCSVVPILKITHRNMNTVVLVTKRGMIIASYLFLNLIL